MSNTVKVGDICKLNYGKALDRKDRLENGVVSVYGANGIKTHTDKFLHDKPSIIIGRKGSAGELNKVAEPFWALDVTYFVTVDESIVDLDFLFYSLITLNLPSMARGVKPGINRNDVYDKSINLPPLAEQQRIVAKLDVAFAEIDKKKLAQKIKIENVISFEQNILKAALVKVDTGNHNYTLQQLLEMDWIESHLDGNHGGDYPRKNEFVQSGVPYIAANCLSGGAVMMNKSKYLSHERAAKLRKGIAKNGDVLFAHNATVGPTAILETNEEKVILGTSLTYYRCNKEFINNEYLLAFMRSKNFIKQYQDVMRQATRNQVPITKQRTFTFLIPPLDIQLEVVKKVNSFSQLIAEVANQTRLAHDLLDNLKLAILSQELQSSEAA